MKKRIPQKQQCRQIKMSSSAAGVTESQNNFSNLHSLLVSGLEFLEKKEYEKSQDKFEKVLEVLPDNPEVLNLLGISHYQTKELLTALQYLTRSIELNPNNSKALYNHGLVLYDLHRLDEAIASYSKAIYLNPNYCDALSNRGAALFELNQLEEALIDLNKALEIDPGHANAHLNRGNTLQMMHLLDDALLSYENAIEIEPNNAIAHWGYATTLLQSGRYEKGFTEFEWRIKNPRLSTLFTEKFDSPAWSGAESIENKTVLIHSEQGFGDTIQFCRYIKKVSELGAKVLLTVEEPLVELLSTIEGVERIYVKGSEPIPTYDYHCSILSLPYAFRTSIDNIPSDIPYLSVDFKKKLDWKSKLGTKTKPRIGIVWAGGFRPKNPELHQVNNRRNVQLQKFSALKDLDIEIYSLQKGENAEKELREFQDNNRVGIKIVDYTRDLNNFSDTAALIENLDLVISVDTSTAHLAGALGKPVWILNRYDNCWRWLLNRNDSLWYPSAKLFRQSINRDWDEVLDDVRGKLIEMLEINWHDRHWNE
jgi:Tfp pilus assembly protein PilF